MYHDGAHDLSAHSFVLGEGEPLRLGSSGIIAGECTRFSRDRMAGHLSDPSTSVSGCSSPIRHGGEELNGLEDLSLEHPRGR